MQEIQSSTKTINENFNIPKRKKYIYSHKFFKKMQYIYIYHKIVIYEQKAHYLNVNNKIYG